MVSLLQRLCARETRGTGQLFLKDGATLSRRVKGHGAGQQAQARLTSAAHKLARSTLPFVSATPAPTRPQSSSGLWDAEPRPPYRLPRCCRRHRCSGPPCTKRAGGARAGRWGLGATRPEAAGARGPTQLAVRLDPCPFAAAVAIMTVACAPGPTASPAPHLSIRGGHGPGPQRGPAPPARHRPARASRPRAGAGLAGHSCACVSTRGCAPGPSRAAPASGGEGRWRLRAEIQPVLELRVHR